MRNKTSRKTKPSPRAPLANRWETLIPIEALSKVMGGVSSDGGATGESSSGTCTTLPNLE
jgi:hypothetical protein